MKKNYHVLFITLLFVFFFSLNSSAQVVANDDVIDDANGLTGGTYSSFLQNDLVNGGPANSAAITISQISTTNPGVYITLNGSGRSIRVNAGTPAGTYTIEYQICLANACDIASITVNVCHIPQIRFGTIINPSCENSGSIVLNQLPPNGTWTITQNRNGVASTFTGSGTTTTVSNLTRGTYTFKVTNSEGCSSTTLDEISLFFPLNIVASATGTYVDTNQDGFVSMGDHIYYQYSVTNNASCAINNVAIAVYNNTTMVITGGPIASLQPGATDNTTLTAIRPIKQSEINSGTVHLDNGITVDGSFVRDVISETLLAISNGFKLNAFLDNNNNGIQDAGESNFTLGKYNYQVNNGPIHSVISNTPHYLYEGNTATSYNFSYSIPSPYSTYHTLTTSSYNNIHITLNSGIVTYNFPVRAIPYQDLAVYMFRHGSPRPGFPYTNSIAFKNNSNQLVPSGTVTFVKSDLLTIVNVSTSVSSNATGFTHSFTNLQPYETRVINVEMIVPTIPTVALGDQLTTSASITIPAGDVDLQNNSTSLTQTVIGSYDPNDKAESHGGKILHSTFTTNDYLTYTIRFENTGTANALFVKITDLLDAKLDPSSVKMIGASHPYSLDRVNNNLTWTFNDINLPPSVSETSSVGKGYVVFQAKPVSGYAVGNIIPNTANIYFDYNPAIITNTTNTEFVSLLGMGEFKNKSLLFYPNPVKDKLNLTLIDRGNIDSYSISDITGKEILNQEGISASNTEIDFSKFLNGMYLIRVISEQQQKTIKIIKE